MGCPGPAVLPPTLEPVASVVVSPATATLNAGERLTFSATLLSASGAVLPPDAYDVHWIPELGWLGVVSSAAGEAVIQAYGGFGATTGLATTAFKLRAEVGGVVSAPATVQIHEVATTGGDRLIATPPGALPPHAAIVTGEVAGACSENLVYSFAASQTLPNLTAPCPPHSRGEAAFFSAATAMDLREIAWQPLDDVVDFTGAAPPLVVPVAAWVAVDYGVAGVAAVKDLIRLDLALASKLMQDARAGVTFVLLGDTIGVVPPDHLAQVGPGCYDVQLADALQKRPEEYVPGYLNLYYVDEVLTPPDNTGSRSVLRGETCWRAPGRPEDMILFPVLDRVDVILAHELGHALGLVSPQSGHVHLLGEAGFDQQNLMWDRLNVEDARAQHHLSLGQGYRMAAEPESWVNRAAGGTAGPARLRAGLTRACSCDPYAPRPCPPLAADLNGTAGSTGSWPDWKCHDNLKLAETSGGDAGYVVLDGVLWRERFACAQDVVGQPGRHFGTALRAYYSNLVPAGDCATRAAVFLEGHPLQLVGAGGDWHNWEGEELAVSVSLQAPLSVSVHLWVEDGAVGVDAAVDLAREVFGVKSLTGVELDVVTHKNLSWEAGAFASLDAIVASCDPTRPWASDRHAAGAVNVYVLAQRTAGTADGGLGCAQGSSHFLVVVADAAAPSTTLAHHIGHALGLEDMEAGSSAPANLMWTVGAAAGGTHLTLGQIYRLNLHQRSWLQRAGRRADAVDCDDPAPEPAARCVGLLVDPP